MTILFYIVQLMLKQTKKWGARSNLPKIRKESKPGEPGNYIHLLGHKNKAPEGKKNGILTIWACMHKLRVIEL